jgi:hypothetical protein
VSYRKQHPDKKTKERVLKELQENNIDVNQLVDWPAEHCQREEHSKKGRFSAKRSERRE